MNKKFNIGSFLGLIFAICFAIFWTITAAQIAPFMCIFGLFFIAIAVINLIKLFKGTQHTSIHNSQYLNDNSNNYTEERILYCSICGQRVKVNDAYCKNCGCKIDKEE